MYLKFLTFLPLYVAASYQQSSIEYKKGGYYQLNPIHKRNMKPLWSVSQRRQQPLNPGHNTGNTREFVTPSTFRFYSTAVFQRARPAHVDMWRGCATNTHSTGITHITHDVMMENIITVHPSHVSQPWMKRRKTTSLIQY